MAWIVVVPPSPRHPHERYQVCYQQGKRHRSAGIFPTRRRALAEQRAIERGRDESRPSGAVSHTFSSSPAGSSSRTRQEDTSTWLNWASDIASNLFL